MAAIELNPVIEGIRSTLGDMVFYRKNGKTFVRPKAPVNNPNTTAQQEMRTAFAQVVKKWQSLGLDEKEAWNCFACTKGRTGYNTFISSNVPRQRQGLALKVLPY